MDSTNGEPTMNNKLLASKIDKGALDVNRTNKTNSSSELRHMFKLNRGFSGVRSVNVTSDSRYLIITFEDRKARIRILDLRKLEFLPHKYQGHTDSVRLTSITRDNKAFYTASWDGSARRFDIASGKCTQIFSGFGRSPSCFIEPKQKYLFTASYDCDHDLKAKNSGRCWDISTGKTKYMYKHNSERIFPECIDIAYSDGKVYTGSDDGIAYKWNFNGDKPILKYFAFEGTIRKVAVSANYFAAACTDGQVRIHNKFSGEYYKNFLHSRAEVRDVRISRDESKLWSAADDGSVSCFDLVTGELIYHRKPHSYWIWSICLMSDEKILVTGSSDNSISFLSADSGQILAQLLNLQMENDLLISCPQDKIFPNGFFYTTNSDLIQVMTRNNTNNINEKLELDDPRRKAYINKLNLKNLVITRLKCNGQYSSLTRQYIQNQNKINKIHEQKVPKLLLI